MPQQQLNLLKLPAGLPAKLGRAQLGTRRLRFDDEQRRRLAVRGRLLRRRVPALIVRMATENPDRGLPADSKARCPIWDTWLPAARSPIPEETGHRAVPATEPSDQEGVLEPPLGTAGRG